METIGQVLESLQWLICWHPISSNVPSGYVKIAIENGHL